MEDDPENLAAYNNLALTLAEKGERQEALRVLKKALKMCEHDRGFYTAIKNNMARINSMGKKKRKAAENKGAD